MKKLSSITLKEIDVAMSGIRVLNTLNYPSRVNIYNRAQEKILTAINVKFMSTNVPVTDDVIDITQDDNINDFLFRFKPSNSDRLKESIYKLSTLDSMLNDNEYFRFLTKEQRIFVYNVASQRVMNLINKTDSEYNLRTDTKPISSVMNKQELAAHLTFMCQVFGGSLSRSFTFGIASAIEAAVKSYGTEDSEVDFSTQMEFVTKVFGAIFLEVSKGIDLNFDYFVKAVNKLKDEFTGTLEPYYRVFESSFKKYSVPLANEMAFTTKVRPVPSILTYPPIPVELTIEYNNLGAI